MPLFWFADIFLNKITFFLYHYKCHYCTFPRNILIYMLRLYRPHVALTCE